MDVPIPTARRIVAGSARNEVLTPAAVSPVYRNSMDARRFIGRTYGTTSYTHCVALRRGGDGPRGGGAGAREQPPGLDHAGRPARLPLRRRRPSSRAGRDEGARNRRGQGPGVLAGGGARAEQARRLRRRRPSLLRMV